MSFWGDAKHRTRNLEIPRCAIAHLRSGANAPSRNDSCISRPLQLAINGVVGIARLPASAEASASLFQTCFRRYDFAISRPDRPEFCQQLPALSIRGRRECRASDAPAAARVVVVNTRVSHHGHTGYTRHSPRNGFNGFLRDLPGDRAFLSPSPRGCSPRCLTPASGRQDHTTSPSASMPFVIGTASVHRIPPRGRDDRESPLCGTGRRGYRFDLG
jgi:hypothetical protein